MPASCIASICSAAAAAVAALVVSWAPMVPPEFCATGVAAALSLAQAAMAAALMARPESLRKARRERVRDSVLDIVAAGELGVGLQLPAISASLIHREVRQVSH